MNLVVNCCEGNTMTDKCVNIENIKALIKIPTPSFTIRVRGFAPLNSKQFEINLQRGPGLYTDNVILHMACRFTENIVVRNHYVHGQGWKGPEDRYGKVPFKRGCSFEVEFIVYEDIIKISVDGKHFTDYNQRLPFDKITHVRVRNDVNVYYVSYEAH